MPDDLDDEERELLKAHRDKKAAARRKETAEKRVWIRSSEGNEAELPFDEAADWLKRNLGFNLGDEPVQDEPGEDVPDDDTPAKPRKLPYARRAG